MEPGWSPEYPMGLSHEPVARERDARQETMKKILLEEGDFTEYFVYDEKVSARVGFNTKLGRGFVKALGAIAFFKTAAELAVLLKDLFKI